MMYKIYQLFVFFVIALGFTSCEDVIDIDYDKSESLIVIESVVTNASGAQYVKISKSVNVDDQSNFPAVSGATVTMSDNVGRNFVFTETSESGVYSSVFRGRSSQTYTLKVSAEGKDYIATSTMPTPVNLDSIKVIKNTFFGEEQLSVQPWFYDPANLANYYKFNLIINNIPSKNIFVFNDEFNNGKVVSYELQDEDIDLKSGDEIAIDMICIDKNVYHYWDALSQNDSRGGASTTPSNPTSNISNGALGYFSAQTVQRGFIKIR